MKTRILAALLAVVLVVGFASGCQNKEEPASNGSTGGETSAGATEFVPEEGAYPIVDLDGYNFVVGDCLRYGDYEIPAEGTDLRWDAFWENKRQVEEDLNCTIEYRFFDPVSNFDTIFPELIAGEKVCDVLYTTFFSLGAYINSEMLVDLKEMPGINLKARYWNQAITKACTLNGNIWATCNDLQYLGDRVGGMFYNRSMIKRLGLEDPYDLVKADQWTLSKFREMCIAAAKDNGDGVWNDQDTYGWTGTLCPDTMYFGAGNRVLEEVDGKVIFNMDTPKSLETIHFIQKLRYQDGVFYNLPAGDPDWSKLHGLFGAGKSLFLSCCISESSMPQLREMEDEFGWVIAPRADDDTGYHAYIEWNSAIMSVLKTNTDLDKTGPIIEALSYLGYKMHENAEENLHQVLLNGDEKSIEMHEMCKENMVFDLHETNVVPQIVSVFDTCLKSENNDPTATIQSNKEAIQIAVDNAFNAAA